jgi:hypothetical protein
VLCQKLDARFRGHERSARVPAPNTAIAKSVEIGTLRPELRLYGFLIFHRSLRPFGKSFYLTPASSQEADVNVLNNRNGPLAGRRTPARRQCGAHSINDERQNAKSEPWLPIQTKLVAWSLGIGVTLLIGLAVFNRLFPTAI